MRILFIMLALTIGFTSTAMAADDFKKAPKTKEFSISVKKLPKKMQRHIFSILKERGIKNGVTAMASASTKNCPSSCNNSSGGGFCFCSPDSSGNCPGGTTKGGSPGSEYCKIAMPKLNIGVGGAEPLIIQMP